MKRNNRWRAAAWVTACLIVFASGCQTGRINLVQSGAVSVQTLPAEGSAVERLSVYQQGGDLVIFGRLNRASASRLRYNKHVDIAILAPDGSLLKKIQTWNFSRTAASKTPWYLSFKARVPLVPPAGSTIRAAYHGATYSEAINPVCRRKLGLAAG